LSQCLNTFGESDGYAVWEAINNFFDTLPLAASIDGIVQKFCMFYPGVRSYIFYVLIFLISLSLSSGSVFCVHGGIPRELCQAGSSMDIIRRVECPLRTVHKSEMVYDMLWSDPASPEQEYGSLDPNGFGLSARGCTCFGERSIDAFLRLHKFQHVFRGHEAQKSGVGVSKSARLTTIFSTSRDHFTSDIHATCGCVLVDRGVIYPVVRALSESSVGLKPTYAVQSVEATELQIAHDVSAVQRRAPVFTGASALSYGGAKGGESRAWARYGQESDALGLGRRAWEETKAQPMLSQSAGAVRIGAGQWFSHGML
jgi:diadenosine tetraphosphatase ApaH/serine/threonine PP2A family protein phosphatase